MTTRSGRNYLTPMAPSVNSTYTNCTCEPTAAGHSLVCDEFWEANAYAPVLSGMTWGLGVKTA